jgi:uncharacterized OsmC-like protein
MMGNVLEFCQNMGILIEKLSIRMEGDRETNPSRVAVIRASMSLDGDIPEGRVQTIFRVARGCRIHNTFAQPPKIDVRLIVNREQSCEAG